MLAVNLLHRFRQDGIRKANLSPNSNRITIPFSPTGDEYSKFRIVLNKLIPGNALQFPSETMSRAERCTLHQMLSTTIEKIVRGDEDKMCGRTARYVRRMSRAIPNDAELLEDFTLRSGSENGRVQNPNTETDIITRSNNDISRCPIETGVIYTRWGAVSAGNLIAGIAAGSEPQDIDMKQLGIESTGILNNLWGATVAGDVAEAAYLTKGPRTALGADGGWNSVQIPQRYYLKDIDGEYMTKAEIRGDLDGLILGKKIQEWKSSSLKLSQLLDMYYSHRGTFDQDIKACRRGELYKQFVQIDRLKDQSYNFALALRNIKMIDVSLDLNDLRDYVFEAAEKLDTAIPALNDVACINDVDENRIAATDLMIFLDCTWDFNTIYPALSYLLDNIDINPYNSNFTIINAQSGSIIVNRTNSILNFHLEFNETEYQAQPRGFDFNKVLHQTEYFTRDKMREERNRQDPGGKSMLTLFISQTTNFGSNKDYIITRIEEHFKVYFPDLRFLALTSGSTSEFENIVKDVSRDAFQLPQSTDGNTIMQPVSQLAKRIKEIPRRIISAKCGEDWIENGSEKQLDQYIEQGNVNYYRIHPNYFFGPGERKLKVKGYGNGPLTVCYARDNEYPRSSGNNTGAATTGNCKKITSEEFSIELNDACTDAGFRFFKQRKLRYVQRKRLQIYRQH
ncbi:uncharacterized protein CBL_14188 [Carabus blaptoides fortunei]